MRRILLVLALFFLVLPISSAVCTLTLDKALYSNGESPEVVANCDDNAEKNIAYTINWTNSAGVQIGLDTGTTPVVAGTNFFETFFLPSDFVAVNGTVLNVNMTGTGLEGTATATVQAAQPNDIIISNIRISSQVLINRAVGVHSDVKDENGKGLSNALCNLEVFDASNIPTIVTTPTRSLAGVWGVSTTNLNPAFFQENTQFSLVINCFCGTGNNLCVDEDGLDVNNSKGSANFPFTIGTWLNANTVMDRAVYNLGEEIFVSTNVTNVEFNKRIPLKIFHQARCSAGIDNDGDLDRALIFSDDDHPDIRGIGVGQTQMQTKRFIIPESKYLQGRDSQCYTSTETWVINEENIPIFGYSTTSPVFNITSDSVQIDPTWAKINGLQFNAIVNMSATAYREYNATLTSGNFDIRLSKVAETIADDDQRSYNELDMQRFLQLEDIKNITVRNSSSLLIEHVDYEIELTRTGHIEIEVRNQDITPNGWINVTFELHNFQERIVNATETIAEKTGTFKMEIFCPVEGEIGDRISCTINAQVEDDQLMQKEVDFTCFLEDSESNRFSSINFNQMVTRELFTTNREFPIPKSFTDNTEYTVKCLGGYYNLGSRIDTFSDTFIADNPSILEEVVDFGRKVLTTLQRNVLATLLALFVVGLLLLIAGYVRYTKKQF